MDGYGAKMEGTSSPLFDDRLEVQRLRELQLARLHDLLTRILPSNRFQAERLGNRRVLRNLDDLQAIPFTTRAQVEQDQADHPPYGTNLTFSVDQYTRVHQTSGSQGRPMRWLDTPDSWAWFKHCWRLVYAASGVTPADRVVFTFSFGPFIGFWGAFEAAADAGCFCLATGGMTSASRIEQIIEHEATVVCCTPTYALRLAEVAAENGIDLAAKISMVHAPVGNRRHAHRLRTGATQDQEHTHRLKTGATRVSHSESTSGTFKLVVAGEPGGSIPGTRDRIEKAWGARVFDHAGMTEIGAWGFECAESPGGMHVIEAHFIAEVIDPLSTRPVVDGEVGELVLTNLGRTGSPLIRYRTGDLVRLTRGPCACGRTFARVEGGVLGRVDEMIVVRGNNLYPSAVENLLRGFEEVAEFNLLLDETNSLSELELVVEATAASDGDLLSTRIGEAFRDRFHFAVTVRVVAPGSLPRFDMKARRIVRRSPRDRGDHWT